MWSDWKRIGFIPSPVMISLKFLARSKQLIPSSMLQDDSNRWGIGAIPVGHFKWIETTALRKARRAVGRFHDRNAGRFSMKTFKGGIMIYRHS
jgi:hypothetical protein